jgi:NAD(P)-dependent dehydrogenase (short-subunit alcohol dehydrogenase family)
VSDFIGKRVLVTGASRGIGRATAAAFHALGARVAINGLDRAKVAGTIAELGGGERLLPAVGDIGTAAGCRQVVETAVAGLGGLDVLVNNAGLFRSGPVESFDEAEFDRMYAVNVKGAHFCTMAALPALRASRGNVVNVSSEAGLIGNQFCVVYCATKAALANWTRSLALELAPVVRVNAVCPGAVDTDMLHEDAARQPSAAAYLENLNRYYPMARIGRVEEVAAAILFLASEAAGFTTGATLAIDGGATAGR